MKRLDKRLGSRGAAAHSWVFVRRPALPSRWIAALPSYQRNTIVEMRARVNRTKILRRRGSLLGQAILRRFLQAAHHSQTLVSLKNFG